MAQPVNGVLYVESFTPTGNPGEYTFENAVFNIQNDSSGSGAYTIDNSFVLFTPIVDVNTFMPIVGSMNRYKFTALTYIDAVLISGTILFDEEGEEFSYPGNGVFCLVAKATANKKFAIPPLDDIYSDLIKGGTITAMLNDLINILDKTTNGGPTEPSHLPTQLNVLSNGQTEFLLPYAPVNKEFCLLIINGISYTYGSIYDFTIVDNILTWHNSVFVLDVSDNVIFR